MHEYTDPAIRITLLPRDTNSRGTIFGGVILSYIDTAGAIEAHRHTRMERFVTVAMKEVIFHKPVFVGEFLLRDCACRLDLDHRSCDRGSGATGEE